MTTITLQLDADDLRDFQAACAKRGSYLMPDAPDEDGNESCRDGALLGEICRCYLETVGRHVAPARATTVNELRELLDEIGRTYPFTVGRRLAGRY